MMSANAKRRSPVSDKQHKNRPSGSHVSAPSEDDAKVIAAVEEALADARETIEDLRADSYLPHHRRHIPFTV